MTRLDDWLELHGYHPDANGSARARREVDGEAFRFVARVRAALDDYEAGKMTYDQLRQYVYQTSNSFTP